MIEYNGFTDELEFQSEDLTFHKVLYWHEDKGVSSD